MRIRPGPVLFTFHIVMFWALAVALLTACVTPTRDAELQSQALVADAHYTHARRAILQHIEQMPESQRPAWQSIITRADYLRIMIAREIEYLHLSRTDSPGAVYDQAAALYAEARTLAADQGVKAMELLHLDEELQQLAQSYAAWQRDPLTRVRARLLMHAGEMGRLALQVTAGAVK